MAADAVQEAFAKAYAAQASFRGESKPATWLFRIVYNLCLARAGERGRSESLGDIDRPDAAESRPEFAAEKLETVGIVRKALEALDEEDRRLLCLQLDGNLSYVDLAEILICSEQTVRMRVCRARRRLRGILAPVLGTIQ